MVCYSCYYCQKLLLRIQGSLASKIRYRFLSFSWGNGSSGMGEWCGLKEISIKIHTPSPQANIVYLPCYVDFSFDLAQAETLRQFTSNG